MTTLTKTAMAAALIGSLIGAAGPTRRETPLRYYRSIERIDRTKQRDQQAKLERRRWMHANDAQLWQRQRAKWG